MILNVSSKNILSISVETSQANNLSKYHPSAPAWRLDCFEALALFLSEKTMPAQSSRLL